VMRARQEALFAVTSLDEGEGDNLTVPESADCSSLSAPLSQVWPQLSMTASGEHSRGFDQGFPRSSEVDLKMSPVSDINAMLRDIRAGGKQ
jgi:hypothetical protein